MKRAKETTIITAVLLFQNKLHFSFVVGVVFVFDGGGGSATIGVAVFEIISDKNAVLGFRGVFNNSLLRRGEHGSMSSSIIDRVVTGCSSSVKVIFFFEKNLADSNRILTIWSIFRRAN